MSLPSANTTANKSTTKASAGQATRSRAVFSLQRPTGISLNETREIKLPTVSK